MGSQRTRWAPRRRGDRGWARRAGAWPLGGAHGRAREGLEDTAPARKDHADQADAPARLPQRI
eukprot:scaffold31741_cov66-Phaeocystis_antarctica.AAC.7